MFGFFAGDFFLLMTSKKKGANFTELNDKAIMGN